MAQCVAAKTTFRLGEIRDHEQQRRSPQLGQQMLKGQREVGLRRTRPGAPQCLDDAPAMRRALFSGKSNSIRSVKPSTPTFILSLAAENAKVAAMRTNSSRLEASPLAKSIERDKSAMIRALSSFSSKSRLT